jgi:hypothetical protein
MMMMMMMMPMTFLLDDGSNSRQQSEAHQATINQVMVISDGQGRVSGGR